MAEFWENDPVESAQPVAGGEFWAQDAVERSPEANLARGTELDAALPPVERTQSRFGKVLDAVKDPTFWSEDVPAQVPQLGDVVPIAKTAWSNLKGTLFGAQEQVADYGHFQARLTAARAAVLPDAVREAQKQKINITDHPAIIEAAQDLGIRPDQLAKDWPEYVNKSPAELSKIMADAVQATRGTAVDQQVASARRQASAADVAKMRPKDMGNWSLRALTYDLGTSVPDLAVSVGAGLAGGPAVGLATLAATVEPRFYSEAKNQGYEGMKALSYAALMTAAEVAPETKAMQLFTGRMPAVRRMYSKYLSESGQELTGKAYEEGLSEFVTGMLQPIIQANFAGKDVDWKNTSLSALRDAVIGAGMGVAVGGPSYLKERAAEKSGDVVSTDSELDQAADFARRGIIEPEAAPKQLAAPVAEPDFTVDTRGTAARAGEERPAQQALPAPQGSGEFIAGEEGVRELNQGEKFAADQQRAEAAKQAEELGTAPLRVPKTMAEKRAAASEKHEKLLAVAKKVTDPKVVDIRATKDGYGVRVGGVTQAEYTSFETAKAERDAIRKVVGVNNKAEVVNPQAKATEKPAAATVPEKVTILGQEVESPASPSQGQAEAGNYKKPRVYWNEMPIRIENQKGSTRTGPVDEKTGKPAWARKQEAHYGYIQGSTSADKEGVDVYIGDDDKAGDAYVIDQLTPDGKQWDEPKVVVGVKSEDEARALYLKHYPKGWRGLGAITRMTPEQVGEWAYSEAAKQPVAWGKTEIGSAKPKSSTPDEKYTKHADILKGLAANAGWDTIGGRAITDEDPTNPKVVGRTPWLAHHPQWEEAQQVAPLAKNTDGRATKEAVRKALAGEKLYAAERRHLDALVASEERLQEDEKRKHFANLATVEDSGIDRRHAELEARIADFDKNLKAAEKAEPKGDDVPAFQRSKVLSEEQHAAIFDESRWMDRGLKIHKNAKLYRGEDVNTGKRTANEGVGLYVTTDRAQAAGYGNVKQMSHDDLPKNPLRFHDVATFDEWRRFVARELGFKRESEFQQAHGANADEWIRKFDPSIDGIQIGTGHGAFFVKWKQQEPPAFQRTKSTQPDLFGDKVAIKNELKRLSDEKDRRRNTGQESAETGKEDDLFSESVKQKPLFQKADKTDTPEFSKWFGDSKVIDSSGKPEIVYHGTGEKFTAFKKSKSTQGIFWVTNDRASIENGEVGAQGKGQILDLYASIKNPAGWAEYDKYGLSELRREGYDGAILREKDGTFSAFVFDPSQLKSASKNRGKFDPDKDSILARRTERPTKGQPVAEVKAAVDKILSRFKVQPELHVVENFNDFDKPMLDVLAASGVKDGDITAFYYDGGVYIIADQVKSMADLPNTIIHEYVVHYGLRSAMPQGEYLDILDGIAKDLRMEVRRRGRLEFGDRWDETNDFQRTRAAEEMLAYYAPQYLAGQSIPERMKRWVERFITAVRDWVRNVLGMPQLYDQAFIKKLLVDLETHLKSGDSINQKATEEPAFVSKQPTWFSALTRAAETAKREKGTGKEWLNTLRNMPGVKAEEIEATDLEQFLGDRIKITKQEVVDYLNSNGVQVTETVLGEDTNKPLPRDVFSIESDNGERITANIETDARGKLRWIFDNGDVEGTSFNSIEEARKWAESSYPDSGTWDPIFEWSKDRWDVAGETKFAQYTTPGGSSYRELLLTLPTYDRKTKAVVAKHQYYDRKLTNGDVLTDTEQADYDANLDALITKAIPPEQYRSSHWEQPNVIAHIRFDERVDSDGKRVMHIGELQSDWHQAGRKKGYIRRKQTIDDYNIKQREDGLWVAESKHSGNTVAATTRELLLKRIEDSANKQPDIGVPNAPFKTTWPELAMKRAIRWAVENNMDRISWDTGATNAERYDLSKQISKVEWLPKSVGVGANVPGVIRAWDLNGGSVMDRNATPTELPDIIGKDVAEKLVNSTPAYTSGSGKPVHRLEGLDLKVGGEGMVGFYDRILPATVGKLIKKWGVKVNASEVITGGDGKGLFADNEGREFPEGKPTLVDAIGFDITDAMRQSAMQGMPLFQRTGDEYRGEKNDGKKKPEGIESLIEERDRLAKEMQRRKAGDAAIRAYRQAAIESGGGSYKIAVDNLSEREVGILEEAFGKLDSAVAEQRRGKRSWNATEKAALEMLENKFGLTLDSLVNRKLGSTANAETLDAYGSMLVGHVKALSQLAEKAAATRSNEDVINLMKARERMGLLLAPAMGYRSEAGRALNILRKNAVTFDKADQLWEAMGDGSYESLLDFAKRVKDVGNVDQIIGLVRASYTPTMWDKFYEYWINGILSGLKTHGVNIVSNTMMNGLDFGAHALASAFSSEVNVAEVRAAAAATVHGTLLGLTNAKRAFITEEPQGDAVSKFEMGHRRAIGGKLGRVIRIPGRALMAEDEFFKSVAYHQELARLAMREAIKLNPKNSKKQFDDIMGNLLERQDLIEAARAAALRLTFQTHMGPITAALARWLDQSKVGRLIVPFLRTPTNILKAVAEYTPAAPLLERVRHNFKEGGAEAAVAKARIAIGSGFALGVVAMAMEGLISGNGPPDDEERKLLEKTGWQRYSVRFGDTWYAYNRFDPLGTIFGLSADMVEMSDYMNTDEIGKAGTMLAASLATNLGNKSYLQGLADASQAYSDPGRYFESWARDLATSMVPNFIAQTAREFDLYQREARTLLDSVKEKIPGLRQTLPTRSDISGESVKATNFGWFVPLSVRDVNKDPLAVTMLQLGLNKQLPERKLKGVELTSDEYQDLVKTMGKAHWSELSPVVAAPSFVDVMKTDPEMARMDLNRQWDRISERVRREWIEAHPDIGTAVDKVKNRPKAIGTKYLDEVGAVPVIKTPQDKAAFVKELRRTGNPALASLVEDMPRKPRPVVSNALQQFGAQA